MKLSIVSFTSPLIALGAVLACAGASAATVNFTGEKSGDLADPENWTGGSRPTTADAAIVPAGTIPAGGLTLSEPVSFLRLEVKSQSEPYAANFGGNVITNAASGNGELFRLGDGTTATFENGGIRSKSGAGSGHWFTGKNSELTFDGFEVAGILQAQEGSTLVLTNGAAIANNYGTFTGPSARMILDQSTLTGYWNYHLVNATVHDTCLMLLNGSTWTTGNIVGWGRHAYLLDAAYNNNIVVVDSTLDASKAIYGNGFGWYSEDSVLAFTNSVVKFGSLRLYGNRNKFLGRDSYFSETDNRHGLSGAYNRFELTGSSSGLSAGFSVLGNTNTFVYADIPACTNGATFKGAGNEMYATNIAGPVSISAEGRDSKVVIKGLSVEKRGGTNPAQSSIAAKGVYSTVEVADVVSPDNLNPTFSAAPSDTATYSLSNFIGTATLTVAGTNVSFTVTDCVFSNCYSSNHPSWSFAGVSNRVRLVRSPVSLFSPTQYYTTIGGTDNEFVFSGNNLMMTNGQYFTWAARSSGCRLVLTDGYVQSGKPLGPAFNFPETCTNCTVVLDNARYESSGGTTACQNRSSGCVVEFRGKAPLLKETRSAYGWTSGSADGVSTDHDPRFRFVLPEGGYEEGPLQIRTSAPNFYTNTVFEVVKGKYRNLAPKHVRVPLAYVASGGTGAGKITEQGLNDHAILPPGARLVFDESSASDRIVYVDMPSDSGFMILVR